MDNIGLKIKKIRKEHKDTLKSLAEKVDYDWSNLSKVERGVYSASVELLKKITEVYNISPTYFFGEGFTETEGKLLVSDSLEPSDLREKFNFVIDGKEATEEELQEAIRLIRYFRSTKSAD